MLGLKYWRLLRVYCCVTEYPKTQWLKAALMYDLTVSAGLGSRYSLTGASGSGSLAGFNQEAVSHLQV